MLEDDEAEAGRPAALPFTSRQTVTGSGQTDNPHAGALDRLLQATGAQPARTGGSLAKQAGKLVLRGASAEGFYAGVEGAARSGSSTATELAEDLPGTELAGIDLNLRRLRSRRRELLGEPGAAGTFASAESMPVNLVDDKAVSEIDREIAALEARQVEMRERFAEPVKEYAGAVRDTRESIRRALPVDEEFADSLPGQIFQGLGQAVGTLPAFAVPGAGPGVVLGQLYQQGYDDAKVHGESDEAAHRAGVANMPAAALEYAADRLLIGKILRPLRGKVTVGKLAGDLAAAGAMEGVTEGAQQVWQNYVAKELAKYDPERPLDDQVIDSMLVGAVVGGVVTGTGQAATTLLRAKPEQAAERGGLPEAEESPPRGAKHEMGVDAPGRVETSLIAEDGPVVVEKSPTAGGVNLGATGDQTYWRQMAAPGLARIFAEKGNLSGTKWFASDVRELALGQEGNRGGVVVEFDGAGLMHEPAPVKPGLDYLQKTAGVRGEVVFPIGGEGGNSLQSIRSAMRAVEMTPEQFADITSPDSSGSIGRLLLREGWQLTNTAGRVRIVRPTMAAPTANGERRGGPVVVEPALTERPALGKPQEALAAALRRRPDTDFKPVLPAKLGAVDVDLVSELARYGEATRDSDADFAGFAERMAGDLGDRVQAYLPLVWDAVSNGRPVRDVVGIDNPVKLDATWQRAAKWGRLFWEGAADTLRRAGVRSLANAIDSHIDSAERNQAKAWGFIGPAVAKYQGATGLVRAGRGKQVFAEFAEFYRAREGGRLADAEQVLAQAHPETLRLIDGVQRMFEYTGRENRRLGVQVQDRNGGWRPIGYLGRNAFPRMLRDDVLAVLRDPSSNPQRWAEMQRELVEQGNIQQREEAGQFLAEQDVEGETSADFFGAMEKGRAGRLPESWYEYRFWKVVPRYVAQWAERAAQIEAFGQKTGPESKDAFDHARQMTGNAEALRYISAAQDHAYRVNRLHPGARRAIGNMTGATTALFLGNPYSTLRNLIGGFSQSANQFGVLRAISELRGAWRAMPDAEATGALKADIADMLFQDDGSPAMRRTANVALKVAGFSAVENFVRSHNYLTAKSYLRAALRVMREDPHGRRARQDAAFLRRLGFEPERLAQENLRGLETERFLRGAVREAQGGYRYNQVPLFVDSPLGRFLFQFARWGTMATRFHAEHIIKPAVSGDLVPVRGPNGTAEMQRVRTLLPLLRSPFVAAAAGALTYSLRETLFGLDQPDATWDEIFRTMDEDEQRGVELALGRMFSDIVMGGTFGALSDYSALLRDAAERSRFKNPIEPPAASVLKEAGLLAYKLAQQGRLSAQDYRQFAERLVTGYRYGKALAYRFAEVTDAQWEAARTYRAEQDRRFARIVGRRFADEMGMDAATPLGGLPRVNENSPRYDELENALLAGDAGAVARIRAEFIEDAEGDEREREALLRQSALGRQPIKPGGRSSTETRVAFIGWARRRLSDAERRRIVEIQRRYFETGRRGGLFTDADAARYVPH